MKLNRQQIPFTMVANEVLYRSDLSFKAKGMFAYLFSKPEDWDFSGERIVKETKDGRKSVYAALLELQQAGLLKRNRQTTGRMEYVISYAAFSGVNKQQKPLDLFGKETKRPSAKRGSISNTYSPTKKEEENNKELARELKKLIKSKSIRKMRM